MNDKDIETMFIGTLLLNPSSANYTGYLKPEYLIKDRNKKLYEWLLRANSDQPHRNKPYDPAFVASQTYVSIDYIISAIGTVENIEYVFQYAHILHDRYLNDEIFNAAEEVTEIANKEDANPYSTMQIANKRFGEINAKLSLQEDPLATNPADELETLRSWRTTWGIDCLDRQTSLISSAITLWVANPNSGKTLAAIQIATHNAVEKNVPVDLYLAETPILEAKMGVLINLGLLEGWKANEIIFNNDYRTKENITLIRELWDENVGDAPLRLHNINGWAPDNALSLISHGRERLKIVDHAYAMVMQGSGFPNRMSTFEKFGYLFSSLATIATAGDNIVLVFNQFTNEQNTNKGWKAMSASFGGASGANMARTKLNVRRQEEMSHGNIVYLDAIFTKTKGSGVIAYKANGQRTIVQPDHEPFQMYMFLDTRELTGKL